MFATIPSDRERSQTNRKSDLLASARSMPVQASFAKPNSPIGAPLFPAVRLNTPLLELNTNFS